MLVFKACGDCANVIECPHTPKYNEEISYLMFAQKNFTTADVKVECQYFKALEGSLEDKILNKEVLDVKG